MISWLRVLRGLNWRTIVALALLTAFGRASAQERMTRISGIVRDSSSGRVLTNALVSATFGDSVRTARSDSAGVFLILISGSEVTLATRRLGYKADARKISTTSQIDNIVVLLAPVAHVLEASRTTATSTGIRGLVGADSVLTPIVGAQVRVLGKDAVATDSSGWFFVPVSKPGAYALRVKANDYRDRVESVDVEDGKAVDLLVLLDRAVSGARISEMAWNDFNNRQTWLGVHGALIPSGQLARYGGSLIDAIQGAPAVLRKGLRIGPTVCVFVNGQPKPGLPLEAFAVEQIAAIEVYTVKGDETNSLPPRWPRGAACSDTRVQTAGPASSMVYFAAVWTK